jgi:predicted DNA-binding WGR domain protein
VSDETTERTFHCTEDGAHKFWRVRVQGDTQEVHFGRIGSPGQALSKSFASPEAVQKATNSLIARKLANGYVEVTGDEAAQTEPKPVARRRSRPAPWRQLLLPFDEAFTTDESHSTLVSVGIPATSAALILEF